MRIFGLEVHRPASKTATLAWVLDHARPDVVVDVGANTGEYLVDLRASGFDRRVILVEPIPELADELAKTGCAVHAVAASDVDGVASLSITTDTHFSGLYTVNQFARNLWRDGEYANGIVVERTVDVPTRRLDHLLAGEVGRLFVKLDTQGHDFHVLRGMAGIVDRVVGVQTELAFQHIYDGPSSVGRHIDSLAAEGFVLVALEPIFRSADLGIVEADGYFLKRS